MRRRESLFGMLSTGVDFEKRTKGKVRRTEDDTTITKVIGIQDLEILESLKCVPKILLPMGVYWNHTGTPWKDIVERMNWEMVPI